MTAVAEQAKANIYHIGTIHEGPDGRSWTITNIESRKSEGSGYTSRIYTLTDGENTVRKSSRGLTLWLAGKGGENNVETDSDSAQEPAKAVGGDLAAIIAAAVATHLDLKQGIDREEVAAIVREEVANKVPRSIVVNHAQHSPVDVGVQHSSFEALLRAVGARRNVWLPGPAGSGKSSAASAVAKALSLPFYATSVGPQTSQASLIGYCDANGKYVSTQLREAFEKGGVFLLDEVDAGSPAVLVVINALLANGHAAFPDRVVDKHENFVLIAAGNTFGQGADAQYVGRQKLDEATLDRFVFLPWETDPSLLAALSGLDPDIFSDLQKSRTWKFLKTDDSQAVTERKDEYAREVAKIWKAVSEFGKGLRLLVGSRAVLNGLPLIEAGWSVRDTLEACVWKGTDKDTRSKVSSRF